MKQRAKKESLNVLGNFDWTGAMQSHKREKTFFLSHEEACDYFFIEDEGIVPHTVYGFATTSYQIIISLTGHLADAEINDTIFLILFIPGLIMFSVAICRLPPSFS